MLFTELSHRLLNVKSKTQNLEYGMMEQPKYDLEDRLVKFAILILEVYDLLPGSKAGNNLEHQLS